MSFNLINAPAVMNMVSKEYVDAFVTVFDDDILVYSKLRAKHEDHLMKILSMLRGYQLFANFSKCEFCMR